MSVTHNTTKPYILSLMLHLVALAETTIYLVNFNMIYKDDYTGFTQTFSNSYPLQVLFLVTVNMKYALALLYIHMLTFENFTIYFFMMHQSFHSVENLPIVKAEFNEMERKWQKGFWIICAILVIPLVIFPLFPAGTSHLRKVLLFSVLYFVLQLCFATFCYI